MNGPALSWWLAGCLVALVLPYARMYGLLGHYVAPDVQARFWFHAAIVPIYCLVVWLVLRHGPRSRSAALDVSVVIIGAALLRAVVLSGSTPYNPDLGRHLWEGRVLIEGFNPYAAPPSAHVYDALRAKLTAAGDNLYSGQWLRFADIRTVYGPIATALWALPQLLPGDRLFNLRAVMTLFDFCTVLLLLKVWQAAAGKRPSFASRLPQAVVVIYAWSPVCISSFADRGQIDAAMVFFLILAAWQALERKPALAGAAFAAACLVKVSPLLLLLPLLRFCGWQFLVSFVPLMLAGALPLLGAGRGAVAGFLTFSDWWVAGDSVFSLTAAGLARLHLFAVPSRPARALMGIAALAYALLRSYRLRRDDGPGLLDALTAIAAAVLIFSPVTFPWYATTLAAFVCFSPSLSLLVLTIVPMGWFVDFLEVPATSPWVWVVRANEHISQAWRIPAYGAFYLLLLRDALLARKRPRDAGDPGVPS